RRIGVGQREDVELGPAIARVVAVTIAIASPSPSPLLPVSWPAVVSSASVSNPSPTEVLLLESSLPAHADDVAEASTETPSARKIDRFEQVMVIWPPAA